MGRRVFWAEPVQPGNEAVVTIDLRPMLELAGETISNNASTVDVVVAERESGADVTAAMFVPGSEGLSDNVYAFRVRGLSDNYDYVATVRPRSNLRPDGADEADVIIPVRARVRRAFAPVGP